MLGRGAIAGDAVAAHELAGGRFVLVGAGAAATELEDVVLAQARLTGSAFDDIAISDSTITLRRQATSGAGLTVIAESVSAIRRQISGASNVVGVLASAVGNLRSSVAVIDKILVGGAAGLQYSRFALAPLARTVSVAADAGARRAVDVPPDDRLVIVPPDRAEFRIVAHRREQ